MKDVAMYHEFPSIKEEKDSVMSTVPLSLDKHRSVKEEESVARMGSVGLAPSACDQQGKNRNHNRRRIQLAVCL